MTDEQIQELALKHSFGSYRGVLNFARALLSASIADTAGAKAVAYEVTWPNGEQELIYTAALRMISDLGDFTLTELYAAPPAPSSDTAGGKPVFEPTREMLIAARDWSDKKYGKPIGDDAAIGCWKAMFAAAPAPSVADARRDALYRKALAMGDAPDTIGPDTHEHNFEVDPSSGIELCTYCGMSRVAAKKASSVADAAGASDVRPMSYLSLLVQERREARNAAFDEMAKQFESEPIGCVFGGNQIAQILREKKS